MAVISTRVHGVLDYVVGSALVAAPNLLGIQDVRASALAPRVQGAGATLYSLFTDYELSARRMMPMRAHLALDALGGALLAASPWLFGYARHGRRYWLPHVLAGSGEVAIAALSEREPSSRG